MLCLRDFLSQLFNHCNKYRMPLLVSSLTPNHMIIFTPFLHTTPLATCQPAHYIQTVPSNAPILSIALTTWTIWFISQLTVHRGLVFVQPAASRTENRLWRQNSANEPSVMRYLLHGTVYLIIFNLSLTLPVLNDSSILFCFLHALIIELCNVSRTIV